MEKGLKILNSAVAALVEKKAINIRAIDIQKLTTIASFFLIASGSSVTHIRTLADFVEEKLSLSGFNPLHKEGYNSFRWVLLDYGDVVVHLFHEEDREYYKLERLWQDVVELNIDIDNE